MVKNLDRYGIVDFEEIEPDVAYRYTIKGPGISSVRCFRRGTLEDIQQSIYKTLRRVNNKLSQKEVIALWSARVTAGKHSKISKEKTHG